MSWTDIAAIATTVGTAVTLGQVIRRAMRGTSVRWLSPPVIVCIIFGLTTVGLWVIPPLLEGEESPLPSQCVIEITSPTNKSLVLQEIVVEGYATVELSEDEHLYIVVEWGELWWPQYSSITPVYSPRTGKWEWSTPVRIGRQEDAGKAFNIVAISVDKTIHQRLQNWLEDGEDNEGWPGIPINEITRWGETKIYHRIAVTRDILTPSGTREVAERYLSAWENADYEEMCGYLYVVERQNLPHCIQSMMAFPVPVGEWQIQKMETEASEVIVTYTVEMPDPGSILGAAIDEHPQIAAAFLKWAGTWIVWEDTLRLVKENDEWRIKSSFKTAEASNRLVSFIQSVGIYLMTVAPIESPADRIVGVLAFYAVVLDKSEVEMDELIPVFFEQWDVYQENLRSLRK